MDIERARLLIGAKNMLGPKEIEKALGFSVNGKDIPPLLFSEEELKQARIHGEQLVLRIEKLPEGRPLTLKHLTDYLEQRGKKIFAQEPFPMDFFTKEKLKAQWVLTKIGEVEGTRHLSYEAQNAFIQENFGQLQESLKKIPKVWDQVGVPQSERPELPPFEKLKKRRATLPAKTALPSAVEVVYDLLLHQTLGNYPLRNMAIATRSRVQKMPEIDEPERPIDVGLNDEKGIHIHWRRRMDFGRPGETKPGAVPGIPIGYLIFTKTLNRV